MGGIRTGLGLNRALIGKQYPAQDYGVTAEALADIADYIRFVREREEKRRRERQGEG